MVNSVMQSLFPEEPQKTTILVNENYSNDLNEYCFSILRVYSKHGITLEPIPESIYTSEQWVTLVSSNDGVRVKGRVRVHDGKLQELRLVERELPDLEFEKALLEWVEKSHKSYLTTLGDTVANSHYTRSITQRRR